MNATLIPRISLALLLAVMIPFGSSCKKKEATAPVSAVPTAAPAVAEAAAAPSPAPMAPPPPTDYNVQVDAKATLDAAQAAIRSKEYVKAAQSLLVVQRQKALTPQLSSDAREHMIRLQAALAAAQASGDPSARAAAEVLRRAGSR